MNLKVTINNNTYTNFIKDEHIADMGAGVHQIIKSKLEGGTVNYELSNGEVLTLNASDIQAITIEF